MVHTFPRIKRLKWTTATTREVKKHARVFEELLCYGQWLKRTEEERLFLTSGDAEVRVRQFLSRFAATIKKGGNGNKIAKFHWNLHMCQNVMEFGISANSSGGPLEKQHIVGVKKAAKRTQHRWVSMEGQSARRIYESQVIDKQVHALSTKKMGLVT